MHPTRIGEPLSPDPRPDPEPSDGMGPNAAELQEDPALVARRRHSLNYSLLSLVALAIPLGILVAYGSYGFRLTFGQFSSWVHGVGRISTGQSQLLLLAGGGLLFGLVLKLLGWERFHGPANVIVAVHERDGKLNTRDGVVTAACDALALGLGASVGRYGPAVQLGATVASFLGQSTGLSRSGLRVLLGCGVAAAISASFSAPIAGAIFAHEVIIGHFSLRAFAPIAICSVFAVGLTRYHGFEYVALKLSERTGHLVVWEYPAYFVLGLLAAGLAIVYMAGVLRSGDLANRLGLPIWVQPALGGALAGAVGLWVPEVLGLGDTTMQQLLDPNQAAAVYGIGMISVLCLAKLLASVSCLGLRYPGGVFSPAIFMGAALGGMVGFALPFLDYQICVLVGMGALVSCVIGAPLATILIVFELTENYQAATAVMIGVVAANALVTRYYGRSIFHRQILRWGIDLERPQEQRQMAVREVREIMSQQFLAVRPECTAAELRAFIDRGHLGDVFVVEEERLLGKVPLATLMLADRDQTASELCEPVTLLLEASDDLWSAFLRFESFVGYAAPVVADAASMKLVGLATESEFIRAYRQAIREAREEQE
ncbi:MAG: chloride channel protein [Xanthomonadales bacterium]|nr:chloride channel protein [Xanthomonadales bacterium]